MRILFISSGNTQQGISPIVLNQGLSIEGTGHTVDYFSVNGKSIPGYLKAIFRLRKHLRNNEYEIFHAHYSLSAIVASLSGARPLVVSHMGSDVRANGLLLFISKQFKRLFRWRIIVKSLEMNKHLDYKHVSIIPNGVNLHDFKPLDRSECLGKLGWSKTKTHVLFAADPKRKEKNFKLASQGTSLVRDQDIELHFLEDVAYERMIYYFNAASIVLLTSKWEGSPNVIKEAMVCNTVAVSTDVGDVRWLFGEEEGYFISESSPESLAVQICYAIEYLRNKTRTRGRNRIISLGLDSNTIANKIVDVYKQIGFE